MRPYSAPGVQHGVRMHQTLQLTHENGWAGVGMGDGGERAKASKLVRVSLLSRIDAGSKKGLYFRGIRSVIPAERSAPAGPQTHFERGLHRGRKHLEQLVGRLKQFRRIATRYERRATSYLALPTLAAILLCL